MELKADFENTHQQQQQLQQEAKLIQQQQQEQEAKVEEQQQQQQEQTFHVLAVDDSLIDRKLLEKLLRISSYQVTCVDSGDKALEYLGLLDNLDNDSTASSPKYSSHQEGSRVNLIMTDYCMPGMSGYDLLKRVKGSYWKDVPVVVMSSENEPSRISMCLEGGAEEFLLKPLQLSDLEKLQPHLLRSLDNSNQDNNINENDDNNNNNMDEINNFISSNNSSAFSKRKAYTAEAPERRPKMKELAVV